MTLQFQLRRFLAQKALTAARLARISGVSKQVLSQWMNGAAPRNIAQVKDVARALGTTVDHLCFGDFVESEGAGVRKFEDFEEEIKAGVYEVILRRVGATKKEGIK